MLAFITTEFQKLKRYSIILVGMLGVACSPIISIVMQKIMTDEAKNVLNYTFPDLLNSTIWNNMTMFFPMIIALIGGYMINREYTDDTLKNLQVIPISFPKLMIGKLTTIGLLSILLGLCNSFVTIIVGIIACRENMTLSTIIIGTIQICGMALFTFIGEMPLIAHCGKKQNSFKGGAVAAFLLGYISIYFKNPIIRNLYPLSAGLSIVGFNGEGFVTDTTGAYSSSQSILLGVLTMLAMLILSLIIISIPQKETSKDEIVSNYNQALQSIGDKGLTDDKDLQGKREFGIDSYVGNYTADYDDFSGNEIIFGGTALERDNGNKIEISCDIAAQTGNLKLILQTGTDEPKILCDTESSYNDTIELPSASNYVLIEADNFTGSLKLKLK